MAGARGNAHAYITIYFLFSFTGIFPDDVRKMEPDLNFARKSRCQCEPSCGHASIFLRASRRPAIISSVPDGVPPPMTCFPPSSHTKSRFSAHLIKIKRTNLFQ